jgi:hypothetical protein
MTVPGNLYRQGGTGHPASRAAATSELSVLPTNRNFKEVFYDHE